MRKLSFIAIWLIVTVATFGCGSNQTSQSQKKDIQQTAVQQTAPQTDQERMEGIIRQYQIKRAEAMNTNNFLLVADFFVTDGYLYKTYQKRIEKNDVKLVLQNVEFKNFGTHPQHPGRLSIDAFETWILTFPDGHKEVDKLKTWYCIEPSQGWKIVTIDGTKINKTEASNNKDISNASGQIVTIPSKSLEKVIRKAINKPTGSLYSSELDNIRELKIVEPIDDVDLRGIGYLHNLNSLLLHDSPNIRYLKELEMVTSLKDLYLSGKAINEDDIRILLPKTFSRAKLHYVNLNINY